MYYKNTAPVKAQQQTEAWPAIHVSFNTANNLHNLLTPTSNYDVDRKCWIILFNVIWPTGILEKKSCNSSTS